MYRWLLSVLALLGYTGMAAQAQQSAKSNQPGISHLTAPDKQHFDVVGDGTSDP